MTAIPEEPATRFIHRIQFSHGAIEITYLEHAEVREGGKSHMQHVLTLTRVSHPNLIAAFAHATNQLLDGALQDWTETDTSEDGPDLAIVTKTSVKSLLTPRETDVLELLAAGDSTPTIARRLFITTATAKSHVTSTYGKLGAHNRASAVMAAVRLGLIAPS
jgi:DNA-binding CsgD family transcriptional regulator